MSNLYAYTITKWAQNYKTGPPLFWANVIPCQVMTYVVFHICSLTRLDGKMRAKARAPMPSATNCNKHVVAANDT